MGSGGPGNITHIDNLYVKTVTVQDNANILLGDFVIFDTTGWRSLVAGDFSADNTYLDLNGALASGVVDGIGQALEDANNLTTTPAEDRHSEVTIALMGTDWVVKTDAGVQTNRRVGITRLDSRTPVIAVSDTAVAIPRNPNIDETLGIYKHKEFSRLAELTVLNDDSVVTTG